MNQSTLNVLSSLNRGLHQAFAQDTGVYLLGEDVLDPYGGAFKVTQGLSSTYPDRVITTPVSEAGIVGIATGMALRGLRPVVEIMFGDFLTLIADQLVNHVAKFRWMYNDKVELPLVVRTPMGGRRGYGPTHSQTLEKMFLGVPGIRVMAASQFGDPGEGLASAILNDNEPLLFIENKLLYLLPLLDPAQQDEFSVETLPASNSTGTSAPFYRLSLRGAPSAVLTLAAYGYMAALALQALSKLAYEDEIFTELFVPTQLAPFELEPLFEALAHTGRLLAIEEGSLSMGWGAEILARCHERLGAELKTSRRVGAKEHPIPASPVLENASLPGVADIQNAARQLVRLD
jgi:pyruvate/2-oxoglutarate/acetoin dehydrogenase E1 component